MLPNNTNNKNNMSKIISISNHKGGVGKTTSTVNIGAGLSNMGYKVLLIDLDPQANLSQSLNVHNNDENIYGTLRGDYALPINEVTENLFVTPSSLDLSAAEVEFASETGREYLLKEILDKIKSNYDYIFIDTPPTLGLLTINAFTACDKIFIPLQSQYLALQGLAKMREVVEKIQKRINTSLQIAGVFITQYDKRKILNRDVADTIEQHFPDVVFKTKIRDAVALAEAPTQGVDIFRYNPKSNGAEDYHNLCQEIIAIK